MQATHPVLLDARINSFYDENGTYY